MQWNKDKLCFLVCRLNFSILNLNVTGCCILHQIWSEKRADKFCSPPVLYYPIMSASPRLSTRRSLSYIQMVNAGSQKKMNTRGKMLMYWSYFSALSCLKVWILTPALFNEVMAVFLFCLKTTVLHQPLYLDFSCTQKCKDNPWMCLVTGPPQPSCNVGYFLFSGWISFSWSQSSAGILSFSHWSLVLDCPS